MNETGNKPVVSQLIDGRSVHLPSDLEHSADPRRGGEALGT